MKPLFDLISIKKPEYNSFDLSHEKKLSCNMAQLIPIYMQEVVPGDKFRVKSELLVRLAPLQAPMQHRVDAYVHYFYVPYRLIWNEFNDFITGGETGTANPTFPVIPLNNTNKANFVKGTLADYLGIPPTDGLTVSNDVDISALPFRAYQQIYNDWYRDQQLITKIAFSKSGTLDSGDIARLCSMRLRCWEKDYFTSSLPDPQKGTASILPVDGYISFTPSYDNPTLAKFTSDNTAVTTTGFNANVGEVRDHTNTEIRFENLIPEDYDLEGTTVTINDLRRAIKIQEWMERAAVAGSRINEFIMVMFGVKVPDYRAMRAEYLGGGKTPIVISEVVSTTEVTDFPLGHMAGHGIGVGATNEFRESFTEYGLVFGILSVIPKTAYQDGLDKVWTRKDKYDFYWPLFAHLGEQQVNQGEIYHNYEGTTGDDNVEFGYQSRYADYKYGKSSVHADYRDELDHWHMGRQLASTVALNQSFIECNPTHRVFAVTDEGEHKLWIQVYNDVQAIRPMPIFGTPGL